MSFCNRQSRHDKSAGTCTLSFVELTSLPAAQPTRSAIPRCIFRAMSVNSACIVLFVGFSDDRWIEFFRFGVVVFLLLGIIIVVGRSRRHSAAHDDDESAADRPA